MLVHKCFSKERNKVDAIHAGHICSNVHKAASAGYWLELRIFDRTCKVGPNSNLVGGLFFSLTYYNIYMFVGQVGFRPYIGCRDCERAENIPNAKQHCQTSLYSLVRHYSQT